MVTGLIYVIFAAGVVLSQAELIRELFLGMGSRLRLRRDLKGLTENYGGRSGGRLTAHLWNLMDATDMTAFYGSAAMFMFISGCIFAGTFFAAYWLEGFAFSLLTACFCASLPYFAMRIRLNKKRVGSSREGDVMLRELVSNYKINNCNMKEAIEATAAALEDAPHSRKLLYDMARGFNRAYTEEEIKQVLFLFRYSLDTAWGNALASSIYFSHVQGMKVDRALEDLLASLTRSRRVVEFASRENNEAVLMLRYLAPASYLLSVLCACRFFGFTFEKFLRYQFGTPLGLQWFTIAACLYAAGVMINSWLSREKMDI